METSARDSMTGGVRHVVRLAAILNIAYFGVEFAVALAIGSVSLFADSFDFLEDTSVNVLILLALNWSARKRARRPKDQPNPGRVGDLAGPDLVLLIESQLLAQKQYLGT